MLLLLVFQFPHLVLLHRSTWGSIYCTALDVNVAAARVCLSRRGRGREKGERRRGVLFRTREHYDYLNAEMLMAKSTLSSALASFIVNAVEAEVNNKRVFCLGQLESCRVISCTRAAAPWSSNKPSSIRAAKEIFEFFGGIPYFAQNLSQSYVEHGRQQQHDSRRARTSSQIADRKR